VEGVKLKRLVDTEALVDNAARLVRCRSVNPPGDERAAAEVVLHQLEDVGARDIEIVEAEEGRTSVLARWGARGGRVLAWNGHLDVVPAGDEGEWIQPPFAGLVEDGRLWGRGTADMKGAVAAVIEALALLKRAGFQPNGELALSVVADEETGGAFGTGYLADRGLLGRADAAICGEPTGLNVAVAARGRLGIEIVVQGRSAHASQPELGDNAVQRMQRVLAALDEVKLPAQTHPLLGHATLTPTVIRGGESANSVPRHCAVTLDRRLLPGEDIDAARQSIAAALDTLSAEDRARVHCLERRCAEPSEIDPKDGFVDLTRRAAQAELGRRPQITGMLGSTDARFFAAAGIPTIIFGPGELSSAHTTNESISIGDLVDGASAYAAVIRSFLS
jgi:succinyl-diaminopimelate desuccinylase